MSTLQIGITDYTVYPLVLRGGIVQLIYRSGQTAFHCAVASNTDVSEWEAENLCRPFLRLPFYNPPVATSRPGCLTLSDGRLTMDVRRSSALHTVHITVTSPNPVELHCGPAGVQHNYGYTQEQECLMFHGFPDESVDGNCWFTHRNEWTGCLNVGSGKITKWGIGVTVALPAGQNVLSFSAGKSRENALANSQEVSKILVQDAEAFLVKTWEKVIAKVPESIYKLPRTIRLKALEAIYLLLEDTKYEPTGVLKHPIPVAVMTGYRTPAANWDSSIAAASLSSIDLDYAIGIILNYIENSNPDGSLPVGIEPTNAGGVSGIDSFKQLLAWATWHMYQITGNQEILNTILPGLIRHGKFLQKYISSCRDWLVRSHLVDDNTPSDDPTRYMTQPSFIDKTKSDGVKSLVAGGEVSGFMMNELICLSRLCSAAGRHKEADSFAVSAKEVAKVARKHLWNSEIKDIGYLYGEKCFLYNNCHRFCGAPAMPLDDIRKTMQHSLRCEGPLWPNYGIATIGTDEPAFDPNQLWRGPVWIGTNYLVAEACAVMGLNDLAEDISIMSQELVTRNAGFWECHNPLTGKGIRTQMTMGLNACAFLMFAMGMHRKPGWVKPEEIY